MSYMFTAVQELAEGLAQQGQWVNVPHWQSKDVSGTPLARTWELRNVVLDYPIPYEIEDLQDDINPNLPWAENHFQERVGGEPLNPGKQYKNWPWYKGNVEEHQTQNNDQFSHTYMERMWPLMAGRNLVTERDNFGIRFRYGDLYDLLDLLSLHPETRQAYLPIWFPEDLAAAAQYGERVPCTLGYHFMVRDRELHCFYPIRSCDFMRHFRDDVYMASRLTQWIIEVIQGRETEKDPAYQAEHGGFWTGGDAHGPPIQPGTLTMHMVSLHVFEGDVKKLQRVYGGASLFERSDHV